MPRDIHPSAIVSPKAELADDVVVGPHAIIDDHVTLGAGCIIKAGSHITGHTTLGTGNVIGPHAVLGTPPQDLGYCDEPTRLVLGNDNVMREFVSINVGTTKQDKVTTIGSDNFLMAYCHVGHDCEIGNGIVMANMVGISGHCKVEDKVWFGGMVGLHQFVTIGTHAFIGGLSRIVHDCPPYMVTEGNPAKVRGTNVIGLRRRGFPPETIDALKDAQRLIYRSHLTASQAIDQIAATWDPVPDEVSSLMEFLRRMHLDRQARWRESVLRR
ncbi:MAG: acyl-ACP--UDP-N-acetylglucosamine O-acyltransferase [Candidatus Brocadiae bacterium]|nr:acyl-ACP--UDP-N-acetylglucosamine O-acyltransferase [Candidatus Brocadiia bacterium]